MPQTAYWEDDTQGGESCARRPQSHVTRCHSMPDKILKANLLRQNRHPSRRKSDDRSDMDDLNAGRIFRLGGFVFGISGLDAYKTVCRSNAGSLANTRGVSAVGDPVTQNSVSPKCTRARGKWQTSDVLWSIEARTAFERGRGHRAQLTTALTRTFIP